MWRETEKEGYFKMEVAVLFTGGKDSVFSAYLVNKEGHELKYLVTIFPRRKDSWMFHHPALEITKLQAEAMGVKQLIAESSGEKEKELEDLMKALEKIKNEVEGVVSGAIASQYQKRRIDNVCQKLKLKSLAPLWGKDPLLLLKKELELGFEIIFVSVSALGLTKKWLGKKINNEVIKRISFLNKKYGLHPSGEGGEYETLILDCPLFKERIEILEAQPVWDEKSLRGYLEIKKVKLLPKQI